MDNSSLGKRLGPRVFVTVGTTTFDELIQTVLSEDFVQILIHCGFSELVIQAGKGGQEVPLPKFPDNFNILVFEYKPSLKEDLRRASLVISHGGSGSITESLSLKKPLIVVTNEKLMNNHQQELSDHLSHEGYLLCTSASALLNTVQHCKFDQLKSYEPGNPAKFGLHLDRIMNYKLKTT